MPESAACVVDEVLENARRDAEEYAETERIRDQIARDIEAAEQPAINVELLDKTLAYIEAHPEEWDQANWRCSTTMCFAGHAATFSGARWLHSADDSLLSYAVAVDKSDDSFQAMHVGFWAMKALGLTEGQAERLFYDSVTLDDLRRVVADLKAEAAEAGA